MVLIFSTLHLGSDAHGQRQRFSGGQMQANCDLETGGESTVVAVAGPQTLRLADGRFVRLAEILVPTAISPGSGFDPSLAAMNYLRAAALGKKVEIKFGGTQRDRYGVYIAHIYVAGERSIWLQEGLVSSGFAQAFPQADNHACSLKLASLEALAREGGRGHWGLALFKVLRARDSRSILNLLQTYQIVEGKADHATESGGRLTIHFGPENKFGFVAIIEPAARKRFTDKQAPENWAGLSLRIRGWIDRKRGPAISVTESEQIEFRSQESSAPPIAKEAQ